MTDLDALTERFETHRPHLRALAYRMLGSASESDDALQEAWLRLSRADLDGVQNLAAWLTTVVSRICLDLLRSRTSRREDTLNQHTALDRLEADGSGDPEAEAVLVDEVGRALLVVLDTLSPAERIAFVLHDMFAVPFGEIAPVLDRSTATTKKLASRARQRVRGTPAANPARLRRHRHLVEAFLAASRAGDVEAVLAVLAPDAVRRADRAAIPAGRNLVVRGARTVAEEIVVFGSRARFAEPLLINDEVGIAVAPLGRLQVALLVTIEDERITGYELIADPARLEQLRLSVLNA